MAKPKCHWLVANITKDTKTELAGFFCSNREANKKLRKIYAGVKTARIITKKQFKDLPQQETKFE